MKQHHHFDVAVRLFKTYTIEGRKEGSNEESGEESNENTVASFIDIPLVGKRQNTANV